MLRAVHRLVLAIDHLLATPVPDRELAVVRDGLWWEFADHRLAMLSGAQRQLLRLGPSNARRVQAKLRELRAALALEPAPTRQRQQAAGAVESSAPMAVAQASPPDRSVAGVGMPPATE